MDKVYCTSNQPDKTYSHALPNQFEMYIYLNYLFEILIVSVRF